MTILIAGEDSETVLKDKTGPSVELEILPAESASSTKVANGELSARFSHLDEFYAVLLTRMLESLPDLLDLFTIDDYRDRLRHLAKAHLPFDWYVERDAYLLTNGYRATEDIVRTVPMLTADQALSQLKTNDVRALEGLQKIKIRTRVLYPSDQFGPDGHILPVYREMLAILRQEPGVNDWELALWWINPTGWLSGFAPRDLLLDVPEDVRRAAEQEILQDYH